MAGIEIILFVVVFIMGTIGLTRGPAKELGVTMALVVLLAFLSQFNTLVSIHEMPVQVNSMISRLGVGSNDYVKQQMLVWFLYTAAVILTAFLAYHGQDTLAFRLRGATGVVGVIFGGLVGAFNGYLIGGTVWYYLHQLGYPIIRYEWFRADFTTQAQSLVGILPQSLASGMILSALALVLLWWRIAR